MLVIAVVGLKRCSNQLSSGHLPAVKDSTVKEAMTGIVSGDPGG